ncbi:hypothetical protein L2E82_12689 [Cichorium intybus]|uniref:Uncharacterized protein n=1 Tax=Cichorium intybus TaxID=13427 RepID=A0ACB9GI11_CICIN|nr:hypothetical protein L2E82_12689 [Cichorium intybus]
MVFNFICRRFLIHARPLIKLELCCHGLLSSSSSQSYPFTTKTSGSSHQPSFTVTYLINSCGISPDSAILASKHLDLSKSSNTADSVLTFLNNYGFTKSQVSMLINWRPRLLLSDPENTLLPNFQILNSLGFSNTDIAAIVSVRQKGILTGKLQETAIPCFNYLKSVLGSDDKVIRCIKRFPPALTYNLPVYAAENIRLLLEVGVPKLRIASMLAQQPRTFFTSAYSFGKVVGEVKEMGFDPLKSRFLMAIHAVGAMSKSTWDKKMELYKKWGWSEEEIFTAFEKHPGCMMASPDKISRILDFLVNTMGWESSYIVQWPIVICFSSEKRIIPRCLVYQYLAEKGLTEEDGFCFNKWLMYSDTKFLKWLVKRYEEEAPELLKLYHKHLNEANGPSISVLQKRNVV